MPGGRESRLGIMAFSPQPSEARGLTPRSVSASLPLAMTYQAALGALGDPTRRAIFERLADRPSAVVELADEMPVSRPAVSQHLKVLKDVGLVSDHPAGNRRIYRLDLDGVAALREYLVLVWQRSLAAFKEAVEQPDEETS